MKKQVSSKYTQLTINFEFESTTPAPAEQPRKVENPERLSNGMERAASAESGYTFSIEDFEEAQAIELDIMYGRGASLYKKVERELAILREKANVLRHFEATRASIYK